MDFDNLSENGIQKLLNNAPAILQITQCLNKKKGDNNFIIVQLSDGFTKLKKCVIIPDETRKVKQFDVLRSEIVMPQFKDGKPVHVLIQKFTVIRNDLNAIIGSPIDYLQYDKAKPNMKGDNTIPHRKGNNKSGIDMTSIFDDDNDNNLSKQGKNSKKPQTNQNLNRKPSQISSNQSINHATTNSNTNNFNQNSKPMANRNSNSNLHQSLNPPKNQPSNLSTNNRQAIPKQQQNPRNIPQNNDNQPRHQRDYTLIKQLYQGMQQWKLKVRVLFRSEVKTYIKKNNGQESQVFSFETCDRFDIIQMTAFGDSAGNFGNVIELDNVYEIAGGKISKDDQKGRLKIMLTEKTVVNLLQDDISLPMVDDYCLTPEKLLQKDIGAECNVIALVKDCNQVVQFVSRNGKNCKKKDIYLCDPEAQVEVPVTLWFQKAQIKFQKMPYAFQGITVASFNDQRQFSTSIRFNFRQYKQHQYRKFINSYEKMKMQNPVQEFSGNRNKPNIQIFNFHVLKTEAQNLQNGNTITMQKVCYLTQISLTSKNFYLSCPNCKKKVIEQQNGSCSGQKCGKAYQRGKYRYLLNISLSDQVQTIWATAYDEAAQVMLTSEIDGSLLTADDFAKIDQEDMKLRIPGFLDRQMKVTVVAKKESYNNQERIKYGVNKAVLDIDYEAEANNLSKQIQLLQAQLSEK